jgi:hypothetical protein
VTPVIPASAGHIQKSTDKNSAKRDGSTLQLCLEITLSCVTCLTSKRKKWMPSPYNVAKYNPGENPTSSPQQGSNTVCCLLIVLSHTVLIV